MLVAAMNPSPTCREQGMSSGSTVLSQKYRDRISGPLLDRIDIQIEVPALKKSDYAETKSAESSTTIRERVILSRERQRDRFQGIRDVSCNAQMGPHEIRKHCQLGDLTRKLMEHSLDELKLSARGFDRVLKVARTIADLADQSTIQEEHLFEAIQYRSLERNYWR